MAQIYISYSKSDHQAAKAIVGAIRQAGLNAVDESNLPLGVALEDNIARAIDTAQCVVILWSKAAADSQWLQLEIQRALQAWASDRLVLATLDETPLPVGLRDLSPIQITDGDDSSKQQLIERIKLVLSSDEHRVAAPKAKWSVVKAPVAATAEATVAATAEAPAAAKRWRRGWLIGALIPLILFFVGVLVAFFQYQKPRASGTPLALDSGVLAINKTSKTIVEFFVTDRDRSDWGVDLLGESVVPPGGSVVIRPNLDRGYCINDVSVRFSDGTTEVISGVNFCSVSRLVFDDSGHRIPREESRPPQAKTVGPDLLFPILGSAIGVLIGAAAVWILLSRRRQGVETMQATLLMNVAEAPSRPPQVFVSYSHQDERAVDALVKQIEELGHGIWIDRQSTGSQRYAGKIVEAIKKSKFIALMCSQNSFASDHVIREVYIAGDLKKPFIVFLLEPGDLPNDILYFVSGFPRITVTKMDMQTLRLEIARLVTTE
jgi:hypothetical protein